MTITETIALIITAVVIPYIIQLIKSETITGKKAMWLAIIVSCIAGVIVGFVGGIPTTPAAWVTCIFAAIGGVQVAYAAFKTVGVTNKWLDALAEINVDNARGN